MADLPRTLLDNITRAQSVHGIPPTQPMVPFMNIGDLLERQVERNDQKPFLIFYSDDGHRQELSYTEFYEEVCRTANLLCAAGVARGDRIATVSTNHSDVVIEYFAAFLSGAVVVPINVGEDDRRIIYCLQNSSAKFAFVRDQFADRIEAIRSQVPSLNTVVQVGARTPSAFPHFQTAVANQPTRFTPSAQVCLTDEALIVYTSGTTGHPKGVVLTQYNLLVDAMCIAEWHRISADQRMMCVLPLHHVNGLVVTLMTPLWAGGTIVLNQKFHTHHFFERIAIERVSVVSMVPTLLQFLIHAKLDMRGYILTHMRHVICGAGPLTVELAMKFEQQFKIPIIHGYGLSETTCYSCFLPIDLTTAERRAWLSKYGFPSIGVQLPANEMAIQDNNGIELEESEKGEIVIRGHNVMKYYYEEPEANGSTFANGWFRSGDEGFFRYDDQGRKFFFITGRLKELIIRGGANISPFEIDEVLMHIPGVEAAIAVGFENDWYGEEIGAYVKPKAGIELSAVQVIAHCRKSLPFAKSPKVVVFGEAIPVTSTGKYQRNRCKELFTRWKSVQFSEEK